MKTLCATAYLIVLLTSSLFSHAADANADAQFKSIYEKEWAWRQAQRGEGRRRRSGRLQKVHAQLPKVDAAAQEAKLNYWTTYCQHFDGISPSSSFGRRTAQTTLCTAHRFRTR